MEPTQAVDILVAYVDSGDLDIPVSVRDAAKVYDQACRALNKRLADCAGLMKADLRSEAIRQAKFKPDVLEEYATLKNEELDRWRDTVSPEELPVRPRLNAQVAASLGVADRAEQKVLTLLQEYRSLALKRAALSERLKKLRELVQAEPTNRAWGEDLRAHEAVRFGEAREVLKDSDRGWNPAVVVALYLELRGEPSTPPSLVKDLLLRIAELGKRELLELKDQLLEAISTKKYENDDVFKRVNELYKQAGKAVKGGARPRSTTSS